MGKNSKIKSKRGSKSKKGAVNNKETEAKSPKIDPEILKDATFKDCFRFWNGDVYVGEFKIDLDYNVLRHGKGKYFSADGKFYSGQWQGDVLLEAERISYPDGSWYRGLLENDQYVGAGTYSLPQLGSLEFFFAQGRPQGFVTLIDHDGFKWQGHSEEGSGCVTLLPRNHFFDSQVDNSNSIVRKTSDASKLSSKTQ